MTRRYFTEEAAREIIGRRVQARVAIIRAGPLMPATLTVAAGARGIVTQFASGPYPKSYLVGVHWDYPGPSIPRHQGYPIDWYTVDEYRDLLEASAFRNEASSATAQFYQVRPVG